MVSRSVYSVILLWIVALAAAATLFAKLPSTAADYRDFNTYYVPSLAMRRGIDPYSGDFERVYIKAGRPLGTLDMGTNHLGDTPTWFVFFMPLTFLSPHQAYWTWQGLNTLALGAALFLLMADLGPRGREGWAMGALMVLYPPIAVSIWFGRGEMVLLLLLVLALLAIRRQRDAAAGVILGVAALLRAYPLGMLGYLIARRNWKASAYMVGACIVGVALAVAIVGIAPIAGFVSIIAGRRTLGQPTGFLRHPSNLNLGWFVRFVIHHTIGARSWAATAGLIVEFTVAAISFAQTLSLDEDRYGCGFALWIALVTLLSPVAWRQFLACLVPVYVTIAAAAKDGAAPRPVLWTASFSYLAAFFMGGPTVGFITAWLKRMLHDHVHLWHMVPELTFASLVFAYLSALLMIATEGREPIDE